MKGCETAVLARGTQLRCLYAAYKRTMPAGKSFQNQNAQTALHAMKAGQHSIHAIK